MAHTSRMLDKQGYMHALALTRPPSWARVRTHTHTRKCVIFIAFPQQQCFANAPYFYVIRTLAVLLCLSGTSLCDKLIQVQGEQLPSINNSFYLLV